jgi:hypothetical protein
MKITSSNPFKQPRTVRQQMAIGLYIIFLLASVWATGESLARSTNLPIFFCYIVGLSALAGASFCLSLFKTGNISNQRVGLIGFFFLWSVTFVSNTHNLYFVGTIDRLQKEELDRVNKALESVKNNTQVSIEAAKGAFNEKISQEVQNMKSEILNPGDIGDGVETQTIIARIEHLLNGPVGLTDPPSNDAQGLKIHAENMAQKIFRIRDEKLASVDNQIKTLSNVLEGDKYKKVKSEIETTIDRYEDMNYKETAKAIRSGYAFYSECYTLANHIFSKLPFLKEHTNIELEVLPSVPESLELQNVSNSWKRFLNGEADMVYFALSILWALTLEVACFILFYYGVLPPKEHHANPFK